MDNNKFCELRNFICDTYKCGKYYNKFEKCDYACRDAITKCKWATNIDKSVSTQTTEKVAESKEIKIKTKKEESYKKILEKRNKQIEKISKTSAKTLDKTKKKVYTKKTTHKKRGKR